MNRPIVARTVGNRLRFLGGSVVDTAAGPITGRAAQRHRIALLALLATTRRLYRSRDQLVAFLWPKADGERGRKLLSDSIYRINHALGGDAIAGVGEDVRLNRLQIASDVADFEAAVEAREWRRAAELYAGPFLDGFFLPDAAEFDQWMEMERAQYARLAAKAIEGVAVDTRESGRVAEAIDWWQRLALLVPEDSRVAMELMRSLGASGNRAGALRHAREHTQFLRETLGIEPDRSVQVLADHIARAPASDHQAIASEQILAMPRQARPKAQSVAVLPFMNMTPDADNDYFAEGITEDVIAHLSKVRAVEVISRASVRQFRKRDQGLRDIGAKLNVATLLDGSVRRSGDRVRIVARLIDASTEKHIWAETYDRQLTDIFAIQTDVALQIASALEAEITSDERNRIRKEPTQNLAAYQLYLQGRHCLIRFTHEGLRKAAEFFDEAIEQDAEYSMAYAGAALAAIELVVTGALRPEEAYGRARKAIARALELDSDLGEAHCVLGYLKCAVDFDWAGAEAEFRRALELNPGDADAYDLYGRMLSALERHEESIAMLARARELDPLVHRMDLATALLRAGRYDDVVVATMPVVELDPNYARGRATLGWAYLMKGMRDEGLAELEKAVAVADSDTAWLAQLGQAYGVAGRTREAQAVLRRLEELSRQRYVSPYHMAWVKTGLGELDAAIDWLERAYAERAGAVYAMKGSFLLARLRSHPRFEALLKKMNLA